jgi:hypothetical protein
MRAASSSHGYQLRLELSCLAGGALICKRRSSTTRCHSCRRVLFHSVCIDSALIQTMMLRPAARASRGRYPCAPLLRLRWVIACPAGQGTRDARVHLLVAHASAQVEPLN